MIDASNGTIPYEYVAKAKMNSNWACDTENQRILILGDVGHGCLFDMNFEILKLHNNQSRNTLMREDTTVVITPGDDSAMTK